MMSNPHTTIPNSNSTLPTFKIGLVGAGAISAGAYTAGVIDFLIEALDEWYNPKVADQRSHHVEISVFSGASAGAMTAAIATGFLGSDQTHIRTPQDGINNQSNSHSRNQLFSAWVDQIDITNLLGTQDLSDPNDPVVSLLDSTPLQQIADSSLNIQVRQVPRPYIAQDFHLIMTVTNLRGLPYSFKLLGNPIGQYDMILYADYVHFCIRSAAGMPHGSDQYMMQWSDFAPNINPPNKSLLKKTALASGAFPVGLAPRNLSHQITPPLDYYSARTWSTPSPSSTNPHHCTQQRKIPIQWQTQQPFTYNFRCVDGGLLNNEPLELARKILADGNQHNPRSGDQADRAILLIDPFPSVPSMPPDNTTKEGLLSDVLQVLNALLNQARFKPEELILAQDEKVFSRFMISPQRSNEPYPIACGSLGGFGGFLKRDFREHDYFLGRRNAQQFLREHFYLYENNPLFAQMSEALRQKFCIKQADGSPKTISINGQSVRLLPIIPLVGTADQNCFKPMWPKLNTSDYSPLEDQIASRLNALVPRLLADILPNHKCVRFSLHQIYKLKKKELIKNISQKIEQKLWDMRLSDPPRK